MKNEVSLNRFGFVEQNPGFYSKLLEAMSTSDPSLDIKVDFDLDPELDSFGYMKSLVLALNRIGMLPAALKATKDRMSSEIYFFVERTIVQIEKK